MALLVPSTASTNGGATTEVPVECFGVTVRVLDAGAKPITGTKVLYSYAGASTDWLDLKQEKPQLPFKLCGNKVEVGIGQKATVYVQSKNAEYLLSASVTVNVSMDMEIEFKIQK